MTALRNCLATMVVLVALFCGTAAQAQTVQLPTFNFFTVRTTVSVPDSGGAYLGGVNRSAMGQSARGVPLISRFPGAGRPFTNRGIGSSVASSGASAHATIIDHAELDELTLSGAELLRRPGGGMLSAEELRVEREAEFLSRHVDRSGAGDTLSLGSSSSAAEPPLESVAAIRSRTELARQRESEQRQNEAVSLFQQGQDAERDGALGAARVAYQMAARKAEGELKQRAMERLAALQSERETASDRQRR